MASDGNITRAFHPAGWIVATALSAGASGWCLASGHATWLAVSLIATLACCLILMRTLLGFGRRIRHIVNATLNNDFSYKFPTTNVSRYEKESNQALNLFVEHLEKLSGEIRQKEAFLARVVDMTDVGMVVADARGYVRMHNESALRLLRRGALTHVCQITSQDYADLTISRHDTTLNGQPVSIHTISDLRHPIQNAEVESWEKLTRVLTHEIMNSLTPICSIAGTMAGRDLPEETRIAFDTISSSSRSLLDFVSEFRKFSALPRVEMRAVYIKPLLEKCGLLAEKYDSDRRVGVDVRCFPPDVMAYTDESLLSRVIINILKNAVEASACNIGMEAGILPDETVEIRISNDGETIPENVANQIFTPFFTTRKSGSGIGLSLSRRVVTHLGGTLTLQRLPLTTFIIKL